MPGLFAQLIVQGENTLLGQTRKACTRLAKWWLPTRAFRPEHLRVKMAMALWTALSRLLNQWASTLLQVGSSVCKKEAAAEIGRTFEPLVTGGGGRGAQGD